MDEVMELQANLSLREVAMRTKERLMAMGIKSPNVQALYGIEINRYTVFYYSTKERRDKHALKLVADFGDQVSLKFIEPKVK